MVHVVENVLNFFSGLYQPEPQTMSQYEWWSLVISIVSTALIVAGLLITAFQLKQNSRATKETLSWQRKMATQDALHATNDVDTKKSVERAFGLIRNPRQLTLSEVLEKLEREVDKDGELQVAIHKNLNIYEGLSRGVQYELYDEGILREAREISMLALHDGFSEYIDYRIKLRGTDPWPQSRRMIEKWKQG